MHNQECGGDQVALLISSNLLQSLLTFIRMTILRAEREQERNYDCTSVAISWQDNKEQEQKEEQEENGEQEKEELKEQEEEQEENGEQEKEELKEEEEEEEKEELMEQAEKELKEQDEQEKEEQGHEEQEDKEEEEQGHEEQEDKEEQGQEEQEYEEEERIPNNIPTGCSEIFHQKKLDAGKSNCNNSRQNKSNLALGKRPKKLRLFTQARARL